MKIDKFIKKFVFYIFKKKSKKIKKPSVEFANIRSILFIRNDRIGDILISTAFLNELRKANPHIEISIILGKYNRSAGFLVKSFIDEIHVLPKNFWEFLRTILALRKKKFDLIIDPIDNPSVTSSLIIGLVKPKYSLSFEKRNSVYSHVVPLPDRETVHIAKRLMSLLLPFGIDPNKADPKPIFEINPDRKSNFEKMYRVEKYSIGIVLSGSNDTKFWGIDNFEKLLINLIKHTDYQLLIYQTPQHPVDYWNLVESRQTVFIPPGRDLEEFAHLISMPSMIFTPDTAAVHFASAFDIPCIAMYKVLDKAKFGMPWEPMSNNSMILTDKMSISRISPEIVYNEIIELMKKIEDSSSIDY